MNIAERKLSIIKWLSDVRDEELLSRVEKLIETAKLDLYNEYVRPTTQAQKDQMVRESEADYKAGRTFTHEEVMSRFKRKP
ncbi:hypothetical protein BH09BAC1_BH09BAC1_14070 [soil metagenome]